MLFATGDSVPDKALAVKGQVRIKLIELPLARAGIGAAELQSGRLPQAGRNELLAGARIDDGEVDEVVALIDFVAVCRTYASELAINEVTLRTYSDLQQYVEQATEALVQSLRGGDLRVRGYRQMQVSAAIRFCEVMFGHDYASLMNRAAENALTGERKSLRIG